MESNQSDLLALLGIKVEDGKIELDTNKTKAFFQTLQTSVEEQAKKIEKGIEEGSLDLTKSVGIKVEDQKIELDLKKTKSFLEEIAQKAAQFIETLNQEINKLNQKES